MSRYEIIDYAGGRDPEVTALILTIQREDVGLDVPIKEQPELFDIAGAYRHGAFWVAVAGDEIIGTIGMMRYGDSGVLKKCSCDRIIGVRTGRLTACTTRPSRGSQRGASPQSFWIPPRSQRVPTPSINAGATAW